jgi:hypothetical protein
MDERYYLTYDEATGYWWINDDLTGKCYYTDQKDVEIARQVLADHVLYSTTEG